MAVTLAAATDIRGRLVTAVARGAWLSAEVGGDEAGNDSVLRVAVAAALDQDHVLAEQVRPDVGYVRLGEQPG
jgi:hypothetical protein